MCPRSELLLGARHGARPGAARSDTRDAGRSLEVTYERLVVALGAVSRALPIPGLAEYGHGFKDLADAIALRNHVLRQLELADAGLDAGAARRHLTFVFVGAGYAGVEALAELSDLVRDALRYYPRLRGIPPRWILVDAAPSILPEIPTKLGEYAARELTGRGVKSASDTTLEALDADGALLSGGERVETNTLVWTAGVRANPLLAELGLPLDDRGSRSRRRFLRVEGRDDAGRSATARGCRTRRRPARRTRRRHSTRCARHARSPATSVIRRVRTATACSARWRRWAATGGSRTSSACAYAASPAGSSRGRTT